MIKNEGKQSGTMKMKSENEVILKSEMKANNRNNVKQ